MVNLTNNAVAMLYNKQVPDGFEPWLQVIDTKKIKPASGTGGDRYRCELADVVCLSMHRTWTHSFSICSYVRCRY